MMRYPLNDCPMKLSMPCWSNIAVIRSHENSIQCVVWSKYKSGEQDTGGISVRSGQAMRFTGAAVVATQKLAAVGRLLGTFLKPGCNDRSVFLEPADDFGTVHLVKLARKNPVFGIFEVDDLLFAAQPIVVFLVHLGRPEPAV